MSFRDFSKRVRGAAAQLGIRASMTQLNDAIALACYGKKYSAVMAAEGVGKLPPVPATPPFIARAARQSRIDAHALGLALHAGAGDGESVLPQLGNTVGEALDWLAQRYPQEVESLGQEGLLDLADRGLTSQVMSSEYGLAMEMVFAEWVIAEGLITLDGVPERTITILRKQYLDSLTPKQRNYLNALSTTPLRLYLVESVEPGYAMHLRELGSANGRLVTVRERSGSTPGAQGAALAARVLPVDDHHELAGGILQFAPAFMHILSDRLRSIESNADVSFAIRSAWFEQFDPANSRRPVFVSADGGEELRFITDTYRCADLDRLAARFKAHDQLEGDAVGGWSVRATSADGQTRQMCGIHIADAAAGLLTAFYETESRARTYRPILEAITGDLVEHLARKSEDPLEAALSRDEPRSRGDSRQVPVDQLTPLLQEGYRKFYADWADKPLPAFDNISPRAMLKRSGGEARVRELLAMYESNERRMASDERREEVSFAFLYDAVGIAHAGASQSPATDTNVLSPDDFRVNEAWIVFRLTDAPVPTIDAGEIRAYGLMDAASTCILNIHIPLPKQDQFTELDARRFLTMFVAASQPPSPAKKLYLPTNIDAPPLIAEAERLRMKIFRVHEDELLPLVGEARAGLAAHLAGVAGKTGSNR